MSYSKHVELCEHIPYKPLTKSEYEVMSLYIKLCDSVMLDILKKRSTTEWEQYTLMRIKRLAQYPKYTHIKGSITLYHFYMRRILLSCVGEGE